MTTQIEALTALLNEHGMQAKAWKGQRIYFNGRGRDVTAFITFDEPAQDAVELAGDPMGLYAGCALKVFVDANQTGAWKANRAKQVKHGLMEAIAEIMIDAGCPADHWTVAADWRDVIL